MHELLGGALAALTRLTELVLSDLNLSECPVGSSGGFASLTSLRRLHLMGNWAGGLRQLPQGPYQHGLTSLLVDPSVLALEDMPGHGLWGMEQLVSLNCMSGEAYDNEEANRRVVERWRGSDALRERVWCLLPCLENLALPWTCGTAWRLDGARLKHACLSC